MSDPCQSEHEAADVEIQSHDSQLRGNPKGIFAKLLSFFDIETTWGCRLYIAAYLMALIAHPGHYYDYVIKPEQNCLEKVVYDTYFTIATVLIFNIYVQLNFFIKLRKTGWKAMKYVFTQIPVCLMTLMLIPFFTSGNEDRILSITANVFLYVYILLLGILHGIITKAIENSSAGNFAKVWGKASLNLYVYLFGAQMYGALWYSFAIDRVLACWREDYFSRNHFNPHSFVCRHKHKNIGELNCPKLKNIGTENNDFGIFSLALQSRIVYLDSKRDSFKKELYCFRWGLQALSCFGQNLLPSAFILENIFVILITLSSTLLFVYCIGSLQKYLESNGEDTIKKYLESNGKDTIKKYLESNSKDTIKKYLESNSKDTIKKMKMEDRLRHLKEVEEFQNLGEPALNDLCYHAKQVFYVEGTVIIREGEPINEMLFLLHGELRTHNSGITEYLKDGAFIGKELVTCLNNQPESTQPASPTTAQALTKVEALALTAYDLKEIFNKRNQTQAN